MKFWFYVCDQKLLLVTFYVKSYLGTEVGGWGGADVGKDEGPEIQIKTQWVHGDPRRGSSRFFSGSSRAEPKSTT